MMQSQQSQQHQPVQQTQEQVSQQNVTQWEDLDELLDEIDGVLEQNAESFVRNYVQKGGQ